MVTKLLQLEPTLHLLQIVTISFVDRDKKLLFFTTVVTYVCIKILY